MRADVGGGVDTVANAVTFKTLLGRAVRKVLTNVDVIFSVMRLAVDTVTIA